MTPVKELLKPYKSSGKFRAVIPIRRFLDQNVFLTKNGAIGFGLKVRGIDYECLTPSILKGYSDAIYAALKPIDEDFRLYQYLIRRRGAKIPGTDARSKEIEQRKPYSIELVWILMLDSKPKKRSWLSHKKAVGSLSRQLQQNVDRLSRRAQGLIDELKSTVGIAPMDVHAELFPFLFRLVNYTGTERECHYDTQLDYLLASEHGYIDRETDRITDTTLQIGGNHLEVLTLREAHKLIAPNLLRGLYRLPVDFVLATEFKPISREKALAGIADKQASLKGAEFVRSIKTLVQAQINKFSGKDERDGIVADAATDDNVAELDELVRAINGGDSLGLYASTLVFFGPDRASLREQANEAIRIYNLSDATVTRETYNCWRAYLATIPGNTAFQKRSMGFKKSDYADLALAYKLNQGEARNRHLDAEYLVALETNDGTPSLVNLHEGGVFGVGIFGATGSGKSATSNLFLDHLQKYNPLTLILDVGGSYRMLCEKYGGSYMHLGDLDFRANPFTLPYTKQTRRLLAGFVRLLLRTEGFKLSSDDARRIFFGIEELYSRPADERRLSNLMLSADMRTALWRWTGDGEYGSVFDNVLDQVTFSHFKVFDFQGIDGMEDISNALFFYLFMRHEQVVQDPAQIKRLKILWVDEAHLYLESDLCRRYFAKAGKTYRKHNGGIVLATQSAFDLQKVKMFDIVNEFCPIRILLANKNANMETYQKLFKLNTAEKKMFRGLKQPGQLMLKRNEEAGQILNVRLSPLELAYYSNDPNTNAKREQAIKEHGFSKGLEILASQGVN